jgi:hypothetical protein
MAEGSSTRFWPLSRRRRPKQALGLFGERTLFQILEVEAALGQADYASTLQRLWPRVAERTIDYGTRNAKRKREQFGGLIPPRSLPRSSRLA